MQITGTQIQHLRSRYEAAVSRARNVVERSEWYVEHGIRAMEVGGAAFGMGLVKGKFGTIEIIGIPLDLGVGLALEALGFFMGPTSKMSEHVLSLGHGVLACYLHTMGASVGADMNRSSGNAGVHGELSDGELMALARQRGLLQAA